MALTLTINISTADQTRAIHALCVNVGKTETALNAKQAVIDFIKQTVRSVERQENISTALATPITDVQPS